tara:strand:- start:4827 stop:5063 length:237 start_codon:yes stop_codon:yes gene_type:complete
MKQLKGVKTFSIKNEDKELVQEFVDIHKELQEKAKKEGIVSWWEFSYSSTIVDFMKDFVKKHNNKKNGSNSNKENLSI